MATYDSSYPVDALAFPDIPGAIREKARQLKEDKIVVPASHKDSHMTGGSDIITPAGIGAVALSDVVTSPAVGKIPKFDSSGRLNATVVGTLIGTASYAESVPWTGVTGKPDLATVATSGSYNDLLNVPEGLSFDSTLTVTASTVTASVLGNVTAISGTTVNNTITTGSGTGTYITSYRLNTTTGVSAGTYALGTLIQSLVTKSHSHTVTKVLTLCNCDSGCSA